jgi:hypothetical protein
MVSHQLQKRQTGKRKEFHMQTVEGGKKRFQKKKRIEGSQRHHTAAGMDGSMLLFPRRGTTHSLSRVAVAFFFCISE